LQINFFMLKTTIFSAKDLENKVLSNLPGYYDIEGWLMPNEAVALYTIANSISTQHPIVCEIGSWQGKSAYVLASAIKGKKGKLYVIDPFDGSGDIASVSTYHKNMDKLGVTLLENFQSNMKKFGVMNVIDIMAMKSDEARTNFYEEQINMLFIDGNHEYEFVKKDYELWESLIMKGGVLVLHDVGAKHVDGPLRVMEEYIKNNPQWCNISIVGEMCIAYRS